MIESGRNQSTDSQSSAGSTPSSQRGTNNLNSTSDGSILRLENSTEIQRAINTGARQHSTDSTRSRIKSTASYKDRSESVGSAMGLGRVQREGAPADHPLYDIDGRGFKVFMSYLSVGIEPLFAYFLFMAVRDAIPVLARVLFGLNNLPEEVSDVIAAIFAGLNLGSDWFFFNPVTEALGAAATAINENLAALIADGKIDEAQAKRIKVNASAHKWAAATLCWSVGAAADAVAIAALLPSNPIAAGTLGAIVTGLGVYYYTMGFNSKIDKHLIGKKLDWDKGIEQMRAHPNKAAEFLFKVGVNAAARGITFGYILFALATGFGIPENHPGLAVAVAITIANNAYMAAMTRTLPCYKETFPMALDKYPEIAQVRSQENFAHNRYFELDSRTAVDMIMSLTRALPIAFLICQDWQDHSLLAKIFVAICAATVGFGLAYQSYTARREIYADNTAYEEVLGRNNPAIEAGQDEAANNLDGANPIATFNQQVESMKTNPLVALAALTASNGGRICRWIANFWFIKAVFDLFADHGGPQLSNFACFLINVLIGTPQAAADAPLFNEGNLTTMAEWLIRGQHAMRAETVLGKVSAFFGSSNEELANMPPRANRAAGALHQGLLDAGHILNNPVANGIRSVENPLHHTAGDIEEDAVEGQLRRYSNGV